MERCCRVAGLLLLLVVGCARPPSTSDPDKAPGLVRTVLDAWKDGRTAESLKDGSSIHAADPQWQAGARLIKYEIDEGGTRVEGYDVRCPVRLWLEINGQAKGPVTVFYSVATTPNQVVVRDAGG